MQSLGDLEIVICSRAEEMCKSLKKGGNWNWEFQVERAAQRGMVRGRKRHGHEKWNLHSDGCHKCLAPEKTEAEVLWGFPTVSSKISYFMQTFVVILSGTY